tara:strand:+ start:1007 stop:1147 length:141 start_codon:yes stop_codon:yes gene_type:complete
MLAIDKTKMLFRLDKKHTKNKAFDKKHSVCENGFNKKKKETKCPEK